jgi:hypothetical protein
MANIKHISYHTIVTVWLTETLQMMEMKDKAES